MMAKQYITGVSLLLNVLLSISIVQLASATGVTCSNNIDCKSKLLTPGVSVCKDGTCTNPFEQGCLKAMAEVHGEKKGTRVPNAFKDVRICNSDDDEQQQQWCRKPKFPDISTYDEVRISPSNWESCTFNSWIYQILLTELLEVPATMEHGDGKKGVGSFYDVNSKFVYVKSAFEKEIHMTLLESDRLDGDCSNTTDPCAHILPEVWDSGMNKELHGDGRILPPTPNGMLARTGYYIPAYTAINHPELSSFYGLSGAKNRHNVASNFLTPTTWKDYCANFTTVKNCTSDDGVAKRAPKGESEEARYFFPGVYDGYFRNTPESDCNKNPTNCTGHFVNPGCSWATYGESQMYWNDISLSSRGPSNNNNGYSYGRMLDIWNAANATKSNVLMWWWFPDPTLERFEDTEFKFHRIDWKRTSEKCLRWRQEDIDTCSEDVNQRIGTSSLGSCDPPLERPTKYFSRSLKTMHDSAPEAMRSPVYPFMSRVKIPPYAMDQMFKEWVNIDIDYSGYDSRETVCKWVYDNLDILETFIPNTYPREVKKNRNNLFVSVAYSVASLAMFTVILVAALIYKFRERSAMSSAQVGFLAWIVGGLFIRSIGAMTSAGITTDGACVSTSWTGLIGFTLELAPILVKIQAINVAARESTRLRRVEIDSKKLIMYPLLFSAPVMIYLLTWTIVDMPRLTETFDLRSSSGEDGHIVDMNMECSSGSNIWNFVSYIWRVLLLLSASVLAFQSRNTTDEMNESQTIGFLVYSHFLLLIFSAVIEWLALSGAILGAVASSINSILSSAKIISGIAIYFGPKFYNIATEKSTNNVMKSGLAGGQRGGTGNDRQNDGQYSQGGNKMSITELRKSGVRVINKSLIESRSSSTS